MKFYKNYNALILELQDQKNNIIKLLIFFFKPLELILQETYMLSCNAIVF